MIYSINYDLNSPGQNYERVREAVERLGPSKKVLKSTFLVSCAMSANDVWESIATAFDRNDSCLVTEVTSNRSGWMPKEAWEWIGNPPTVVKRTLRVDLN